MHTALGALTIFNVMRLPLIALMRPEQPSQPRRVLTANPVQLWVVWMKVFSHIHPNPRQAPPKTNKMPAARA
jgi:hypothetical protein